MASSFKTRAKLEKNHFGYIFIAPFFITYFVFQIIPLINTFYYSLTDIRAWYVNPEMNYNIVGFDMFKMVLTEAAFKRAFVNTPVMWIMGFIPQLLMALLLASWFTNEKIRVKGQGFFKVVFYMPNIMTATTIGLLFLAFIRPNGFIHNIALSIGYLKNPSMPFTSGWFGRGVVAFINFWMWYGQTMIVLIAGIMGINPSFFEAASIDGASGWQSFWRITLPLIRPIMTYSLVTSLIGGFQMFDVPNMMGNGDNAALFRFDIQTIVMYIKTIAQTGSNSIGKACAASVILFLITAVCSCVLFYLTSDRAEAKAKRMEKKLAKEAALQEGGDL